MLGRPSKQTQTPPIRDSQLCVEVRKLTMGMNGHPFARGDSRLCPRSVTTELFSGFHSSPRATEIHPTASAPLDEFRFCRQKATFEQCWPITSRSMCRGTDNRAVSAFFLANEGEAISDAQTRELVRFLDSQDKVNSPKDDSIQEVAVRRPAVPQSPLQMDAAHESSRGNRFRSFHRFLVPSASERWRLL